MKSLVKAGLALGFACSAVLVVRAQLHPTAAVKLVGALHIPPGGIASIDISWGDSQRGRLYVADRTNKGIDIIDTKARALIGRIPGFFGGTGPTGGPSGVFVTPENILWAGDTPSKIQVVDLNKGTTITKTIVTGHDADGRVDEGHFSMSVRQVMFGIDAAKPPYVLILSMDTYAVLAKISFPDATGMEQPYWDPFISKWLVMVPAAPQSYIAIIDPLTFKVIGKFLFPNHPACNGSANGLVVSKYNTLLASACGQQAFVMNATTGEIINVVTQVTAGDQVAFGDPNFFMTGNAGTPAVKTVGVVDARSGAWVQNLTSPLARNGDWANGTFFATVPVPAAGPDPSMCLAKFGISQGCVLLYNYHQ